MKYKEIIKKWLKKWYLNYKKVKAIKKRYDLVSCWWKKALYIILMFEFAMFCILSIFHDGIGENGEHYMRFGNQLYYIGYMGDVSEIKK